MSLLKRPTKLGLNESFGRDLSFNSGIGSASTISRKNKNSDEYFGSLNSFRKDLRQQVTSRMQTPANFGSTPKSSTADSQRKPFFGSRGLDQQPALSNRRESLTGSFNLNVKTTSPTGENMFKKRIVDSIAHRLGAKDEPGDFSALKVRRKSVKRDSETAVPDVWAGLNTSGMIAAKRSGSTPLRDKLTALQGSRIIEPTTGRSGFDANTSFGNTYPTPKSPFRDPTIKLLDGPSLVRPNLAGIRNSTHTISSTVLNLKDELSRRHLLSPHADQPKRTDKITFGDWKIESSKKSDRSALSDLKTTTEFRTHELRLRESVSSTENRKSARGLGDLTDELNRIRSHTRAQIAERPLSSGIGGRLSQHDTPLQGIRTGADDRFDKLFDISPDHANAKHHSYKDELRRKNFADIISLGRIYELQDVLTDVSDKEFNELPASYIEEMIKLSSVIMHRVKSSNYYTTKS